MHKLLARIRAMRRAWNAPIPPNNVQIPARERVVHFERMLHANQEYARGIQTPFGRLLVEFLFNVVHDIETVDIWKCDNWETYIAIRSTRSYLNDILLMLLQSPERVRDALENLKKVRTELETEAHR